MNTLPLILLGLRSAFKPDLHACTAELVYRSPLCLHGQLLNSQMQNSTAPSSPYVSRLKRCIQSLKATPTKYQCCLVYIKSVRLVYPCFRQTRPRENPVEQPYKGPYLVLQRFPKCCKLDLDGHKNTISLNCLKAAFIETSAESGFKSHKEISGQSMQQTQVKPLQPRTVKVIPLLLSPTRHVMVD